MSKEGRIIGLNSLHYAPLTADAASGATYGEIVSIPNVISLEVKDSTESLTFYSDDRAEQVINSFGAKEVTVTLGTISNELEATLTGNTYRNGVFIQSANAASIEVALLFKAPLSKPVGAEQYIVLYKGVLTRTDSNYQSKEEGVSDQQITLTGTFMPLAFNGQVSAKANSHDTGAAAIIAKWFEEVPVTIPPASEAAKVITNKK